jgi:hypothetical protein
VYSAGARTRNPGQARMRADGEELHPQLGYCVFGSWHATFANVFPVNQGRPTEEGTRSPTRD